MEADGLVTRRRDPVNRRIHHVEPTEAGEALFRQLAGAAIAFDQRLRAGLADSDIDVLERVLGQLHANVTARPPQDGSGAVPSPPDPTGTGPARP